VNKSSIEARVMWTWDKANRAKDIVNLSILMPGAMAESIERVLRRSQYSSFGAPGSPEGGRTIVIYSGGSIP
jgi:hypothetical protein